MSSRATHRIQVELPADAFAHCPWDPAEVAEELRNLWLVEQVRERRLGFAKAAELAGLPLATFMGLMHHRGVTPFDYDPDEIRREIG